MHGVYSVKMPNCACMYCASSYKKRSKSPWVSDHPALQLHYTFPLQRLRHGFGLSCSTVLVRRWQQARLLATTTSSASGCLVAR